VIAPPTRQKDLIQACLFALGLLSTISTQLPDAKLVQQFAVAPRQFVSLQAILPLQLQLAELRSQFFALAFQRSFFPVGSLQVNGSNTAAQIGLAAPCGCGTPLFALMKGSFCLKDFLLSFFQREVFALLQAFAVL